MTDLSWPDEVGTWVGMDGVEYDVVISLEDDNVRKPTGGVVILARVFALLLLFFSPSLEHPRISSASFEHRPLLMGMGENFGVDN